MTFKALIGSALLAFAASSTAFAADCGPLKLLNEVQLTTFSNGLRPMLPVAINGVPKLMLLDTGGYISQLSQDAVNELQLSTPNSSIRLYDVSGNSSRDYAVAESFKFGNMSGLRRPFIVSPIGMNIIDGIFATDYMLSYDVDIDFGSGKMRFFSPEHCPGNVVYWNAPAVATVPITIKDRFHITVPVKLDGVELEALIDTGATTTTISLDTARRRFGVTPQSEGVERSGDINGDPKLASYRRTFQALSFDGVDIKNLRVTMMPDRVGSGSREMQTGNRALAVTADMKLPQLILGMDVLRHLHIYMAFKEKRFYVSAGSPRKADSELNILDQAVSQSPTSASLLNARCWERGLKKTHLEEALQDCESALKSNPNAAHIIDSKGLVLFQLGRYQDAVLTYDQALKLKPNIAASLFMRGQAKLKLGDTAEGESDVAAAKTINPQILSVFEDAQL